ncbi:DUF2516 family protein [Streptomyces sp. H27-D2]|uniref:DUF2516 family protein n=1 Tax=Streptomyces sp. H27-D2 TaxID=3046304 RepID=UPI002DB89694|nr:DUF2516 family protein [Streptomyces sp. H27-D2]MEC4015692.1 DUF2516 family protein [Streptomyces sp. H27-D2]
MLVQGFNELLWWASMALLVFSVFAFVDAAIRREDAYRAADKKTKPFWLIVLGLVVAVNLYPIMFFLQIIGIVATIVYMVDVRPAVKQISGGGGRGGGRRSGGSSSDGPYGPYNGGR